MTVASALRLRDYVLRERYGKVRPDGILSLHMKRPFRGKITLRETGSDLTTFREIAVAEVYGQVIRQIEGFQNVIDLGANIGLASLYLAHHSPKCRILSVEPNPKNYELLVRNLSTLSISGRCRTLRAAAWGTHRHLSPDPEVPADRFDSFTLRESLLGATHDSGVEGLTMRQILEYAGFDRVDLLKVDIEGAEAQLFSGNDLEWLSRVGAIAIEFHKDARTVCGFDDIMKRYEFEIRSEGQHTLLARKIGWVFPRSA